MALWGKTDALVSIPKYVARKALFDAATAVDTTAETINILSSGTGFATGDAVTYNNGGGTGITNLTNNSTYTVRVVGAGLVELYDTYDHAVDTANTTGRINLAGSPTGTQSLQRTGAANAFGDHIYNGRQIVFVDSNEATVAANKAKGITGAGWYAFITYTDAQSVTRTKAECLVAFASSAADAGDAEDSVTVDRAITIDTQPTNVTVDLSDSTTDTATFSVVASATGTGDLTYQWQKQESGSGAWANVSGATAASYTTGVLTVVADNTDKYRVVVSTAGAADVTSDAATLTVQA